MAKICPICKKSSIMRGQRSNRVRATKYNPTARKRKYPNLQWARLLSGKRIKICTNCLKKGRHLTAKI